MEQTQQNKQRYQDMVKKASPNSHILTDCIKAFIIGGIICVLGQFLIEFFTSRGISKDDAGLYCSIILVFLSCLFTGLGWYGKLGKFAGAGSVVPITGFANSVAAPAIEHKKEGLILGVGARMFIVAGPVIVYGVLTSVVVGLVYYFMK